MDWIIEHWDEILKIIGAAVVIASVVVNLTPTKTDNKVLKKVKAVLNRLSLLKDK